MIVITEPHHPMIPEECLEPTKSEVEKLIVVVEFLVTLEAVEVLAAIVADEVVHLKETIDGINHIGSPLSEQKYLSDKERKRKLPQG
jgi:hypothetical protein